MNTKTLMSFKIDKKLKQEAQKTAEQVGFPLSTLINAYLRKFVQTKEVDFAVSYKPTKSLIRAIKQAEKEYTSGKMKKFATVKELMEDLNS